MQELKCYSVDIPMDVVFENAMTEHDELTETMEGCEGLIGVNPDAANNVAHVLFRTIASRNEAYKKLKEYDAVINTRTAYVNV